VTVEDEARVRAKELYGLAPEGFIEGRDALAVQLADEGEHQVAAAIKKLRKPTVVAWAVNTASRERPADVAALLRAGDDLRQAQVAAISGKGSDDLRTATQARRTKVAALADYAWLRPSLTLPFSQKNCMATLFKHSLSRHRF